MSDITNGTRVRLSLAVLLSLLTAAAAASGIYKVMEYKVDQVMGFDAASRIRDEKLERRIERVEDALNASQKMLERIDERTGEMKRQLDKISK